MYVGKKKKRIKDEILKLVQNDNNAISEINCKGLPRSLFSLAMTLFD